MSSFKGYGATKTQVEELFQVLSIMRPHGSRTEQKFVEEFIYPLKPTADAIGNLHVRIGDAPIMWSCHTDTVHSQGGIAPIKLGDDGLIKVHPKSQANCLGADDGAGVWLMMQMIRAERPGLYVFHRGEEKGGIGSRWLAKNTPKVLDGIQAAIAFDRKGNDSIITHQFGGRCCSEDFSKSLATAIGLNMKSDNGGTFTDTASYTDLVGECTNVSVGYKYQHCKTEEQDMLFLLNLHDHMLEVDTRDLVFKRKPGEKEARTYPSYRGRGADDYGDYWDGYGGYGGYDYGRHAGGNHKKTHDKTSTTKVLTKKEKKVVADNDKFDVCRVGKWGLGMQVETHLALVEDFPHEIAQILKEKGYGLNYLHIEIRKRGGIVKTGFKLKPN